MHHLLLLLGHLAELLLPSILSCGALHLEALGHLARGSCAIARAHHLICFSGEALGSHCLLDVLLKLFILLTPHLINFLLWESLKVLHHLLRQLTLSLLLPGKDSFYDLLPECLHICTSLTGAFWLIDARELVLTGSDVYSICGVDLDIALRRHVEKLRHEQGPVELTG